MATTAQRNKAYFDAQVRRRIRERRTIAGLVAAILADIEKDDRKLAEYLRLRLASIVRRPLPEVQDRLRALLTEIEKRRRDTLIAARKQLRSAMGTLAVDQPAAEEAMLREALGEVTKKIATVEKADVRELALTAPFAISAGKADTLTHIIERTRQSDAAGIRQAILDGIARGSTLDEVMQRIAGSRSKSFTDGVLATTRQNVAAVSEAGMQHGINTGAGAFWTQNATVFGIVLRWTAMLDSSVCPTCASRDDHYTTPNGRELPPGLKALRPASARPPAHLRCRCAMVAYLPGEISDSESYPQWLAGQPAAVQDEVLGKKKAGLYRSGKVKVSGFVDERGRELTLDELRK